MATNRDIVAVAEEVLAFKAAHGTTAETFTTHGVTFDDLIYDDGHGGRCQENTRKVIEAATGKPMPGKACCAGATFANLYRMKGMPRVVKPAPQGKPEDCQPGDVVFFSGGPKCHTCGRAVGHVGIWLPRNRKTRAARMFQHTSRANLGITQAGPTTGQRARFVGAFRLAPLEVA